MFLCSVDDGFPTVTFHFEDSLSLTVYPHEYLFDIDVSETNFEVGLKFKSCFGVSHLNNENL